MYFKGEFDVKIDNKISFKIIHYGKNFYSATSLFWRGVTGDIESESMKIWIKLSKISTVIFDIGSNFGTYSLVSKAIRPQAIIHAFEPVPYTFNRLEKNIKINQFDINCHQEAMSNMNGQCEMNGMEENSENCCASLNKDYTRNLTGSTIINTRRLDSFIEEQNIQQIDLMKIDVETFEPQVLEGMGKYLAIFKPSILIEILNDEVASKVEKIVEGVGYKFFCLRENNITKEEKLFPLFPSNFLLCVDSIAQKIGL